MGLVAESRGTPVWGCLSSLLSVGQVEVGAGLKGDSELVPGQTKELPWEAEAP